MQSLRHSSSKTRKLLGRWIPAVNKAFGSLCYDKALSDYGRGYCVKTLSESITETEN